MIAFIEEISSFSPSSKTDKDSTKFHASSTTSEKRNSF
jgi:hypothetical protein